MSANPYGIQYGREQKSFQVLGGGLSGVWGAAGGDYRLTSLRIDQYGLIEDIGRSSIDPPASTEEVIAVTLSVESFILDSTADISRHIDLESTKANELSDSIVKMMAGAGYIALRNMKKQGSTDE